MTLRATAAAAVLAATALLGLAPQAGAAPVPQPAQATAEHVAAAGRAAAAPDTLATLSRFFAREGRVSVAAAQPRVEGEAIPVHHLSPEFVAGRAGAPVARLEFLASRAVSADGQEAALWTARTEAGRWEVVNIATGDDEFRYARLGAEKLPGGTVFREPQIDAWYVAGGGRVLPLDDDAAGAVGAGGVTLGAYRARVAAAYGDKLPGSRYAERGAAGGYAEGAAGADVPGVALPAAGALALGAAGLLVLRRRRRARA
ncbi:LPXTG cell wall anchor domain-containing protein [Streptomyces sp. NPDC047014]|uniref:LPXTG cell wall anchor domain-containing protein n=1 Tax=Streptomyces sp. NPDC047014 TaxID=3155736 RepID=UPI00340E70FC